jgi:hypothetical protein
VTPTARQLTSYVLRGWIVLDERRTIGESGAGARLAFIDTELECSEFRLWPTEQTAPGTHFSIQAIEIHGKVDVIDTVENTGSPTKWSEEFDPWAVKEAD